MKNQVWCHKDRKNYYYQTESDSNKFHLCMVKGSLASVITYDSEEHALADGWYKYNGVL